MNFKIVLAILITPLSVRITFRLLGLLVSCIPEKLKNRPSSCMCAGYPMIVCSYENFWQSSHNMLFLFRWIYWGSFLLCFLLKRYMPWPLLVCAIPLLILCIAKFRLLFTVILVAIKNRHEWGAPPALPIVSACGLLFGYCNALYVFLSTIPAILRSI